MQRNNEQKVIWLLHSDNKEFREIDKDGNRVFFSKETIKQSYEYKNFSLLDTINNLMYTIDLDTGEFYFNNIAIEPCKNINGRMMSFANLDIDYREGLIQYKESFPIEIGHSCEIVPQNFNIGLHFDTSRLNLVYPSKYFKSQVINVKVILSIDAITLRSRFSISITEKRFFDNDKSILISI